MQPEPHSELSAADDPESSSNTLPWRWLGRPWHWLRSWLTRLSMRQLFVLAVLAGLGLPGVLVTLVNREFRRQELENQFRIEQERALEILSLGMRQPLWDLSRLTGKPLVESVMKDERVVAVRIDGSFSNEPFLAAVEPSRQTGQLARLTRQVFYDGQSIGSVTIDFDDGHLQARLAKQTVEYTLLIVLELTASLGLILFLLDARFLRPLRRLSLQASALTQRVFQHAFVWDRSDEIGDVGRQLEWSRRELLRLFDELHHKNRELELDIIERKNVEVALRASEGKYRELFLSNLDGIFVVDLDGRCLDANPAMEAMLGYPTGRLAGVESDQLVPSRWRDYDRDMRHRVLLDGHCGEYEIELRCYDCSVIPVSAKGVLMRDEQGRPVGVWRIMRDLSERQASAAQMELASKVFDNTTEAILVTDQDSQIISINRAFTDMFGYTPDQLVGRDTEVLRDLERDGGAYALARQSLLRDGAWQGELPLCRRDGESFTAWVQVNVVRNVTGQISNVVMLMRDISAIKVANERILHLARFDALTELPNRAYFRELVDAAITATARHDDRFGLLFVDLDHFKTVNDSLGHAVGDALLRGVAQCLNEAIRAGDVVGRLGGDEFVVLLQRVDSNNDAAFVAARILERLAQPFRIGEHELVVTPSVGIALYREDGEDYDTLIRNADAAMYHAKESGRNNYQFYTADMNARASEILLVESQLRRALERDEFVLHYQPQVDMRSGRLVGVEALIRWQHPERGLVGPNQFIPIAEERGLIAAIGNWALREACRQNKAWQRAGLPAIEVAVNLSALQFHHQDIANFIAAQLAEFELDACHLCLEVTESIIMEDAESTVSTMSVLKQMGLRLAIDDFGTGYSSLSYLKRFKADKLKIDRSFVADVPGDSDDSAITRAVISLARNLNLQVIAEGVETAAQWQFLQSEGCDEVQGYLISRPLPAAELGLRLAAGEWLGREILA
ncbi:EAL domain-containing protein [Chitinimonas lacunae]|uniref:EAL domain-containing protein n=1 Tax=Chitinimonas lacunae TaxID=1963018 RepID=A0ABV8MUZ1_9NEIS